MKNIIQYFTAVAAIGVFSVCALHAEDTKATNNTAALKRLGQLLKLEKKEITNVYFYAILSGLVQLSLPLGVQSIIGLVMGTTMVTSIYILIGVVVIGVLTVGMMHINQMKVIEKIQQRIFTRYAFDFADTIPKLKLNYTNDYYLPEKANRFFETITLQKGVSKILLDMPIARTPWKKLFRNTKSIDRLSLQKL